jgi:hypothetical protein
VFCKRTGGIRGFDDFVPARPTTQRTVCDEEKQCARQSLGEEEVM